MQLLARIRGVSEAVGSSNPLLHARLQYASIVVRCCLAETDVSQVISDMRMLEAAHPKHCCTFDYFESFADLQMWMLRCAAAARANTAADAES